MAAQKKRAATKKVAARATPDKPIKKISAKKRASMKTFNESMPEDTANVRSSMTPKQRQEAILRGLEKWEYFHKLPLRQMSMEELQFILDQEMARMPPRKAFVMRTHSVLGVLRNRLEREELLEEVERRALEYADAGGS